MTHSMKLQKQPFDQMASGKKQYEFRLYDEKRRSVHIGDTILFVCEESRISVTVTEIIRADCWEELEKLIDTEKTGDTTPLPQLMRRYYSIEDEKTYGCVAIGIGTTKGMI